jgi:hypothetical protein
MDRGLKVGFLLALLTGQSLTAQPIRVCSDLVELLSEIRRITPVEYVRADDINQIVSNPFYFQSQLRQILLGLTDAQFLELAHHPARDFENLIKKYDADKLEEPLRHQFKTLQIVLANIMTVLPTSDISVRRRYLEKLIQGIRGVFVEEARKRAPGLQAAGLWPQDLIEPGFRLTSLSQMKLSKSASEDFDTAAGVIDLPMSEAQIVYGRDQSQKAVIRLYDAQNKRIAMVQPAGDYIESAHLSPDGSKILVLINHSPLKSRFEIYDSKNLKMIRGSKTLVPGTTMLQGYWTSNSEWIDVQEKSIHFYRWNESENSLLASMAWKESEITATAFDEKSKILFIGTRDGRRFSLHIPEMKVTEHPFEEGRHPFARHQTAIEEVRVEADGRIQFLSPRDGVLSVLEGQR